MSNIKSLTASGRTAAGGGAVKRLRGEGFIPAVVYGAKQKAASVQLRSSEVRKILSHAVGENILIQLEFDDQAGTNTAALIQEVQHHPLTREILHMDLLAVSMDEEIQAEVPIEPLGEASGVKNFAGILEQNIRVLQVACLPRDLPQVIEVDVSALNIGESIHIGGIALPPGVKALQDAELSVFHVLAPRVEEAPAEVAEAAPAEPEAIRQKKPEAEEKEGAEKKGKEGGGK